jgi:Uncharacterized protein conserved in bacteria
VVSTVMCNLGFELAMRERGINVIKTKVGDRYVLEVSSPGMERPLRTEGDWRRFTGRKANVKCAALGGRVEVEIVGVEEDAGAVRLRLRDGKGEEHLLGLAEVDEARLAFHWKP